MRSRSFAAIGMLLLLCGGVVLAGSTFGFTTVAADRGVAVTTAQEEAYVGLEPVGESINGKDDTATVARIHNNFASSVRLETTVSQGADLAVQSDFDTSVAAGDSTALALTCNGGGGSGTQSVSVVVDQATSDGITVEGASMTVSVDYQCTGNSKGQLNVQSVSQSGVGTVAFEVENSGSKDAKIKSASIDDTTSDATQVSNENGAEISIDGAAVVDTTMVIDGTEYSSADKSLRIPAGETVTVTIGEFQNGGNVVNMEGETVEFTLYDSKSSHTLSGTVPVSVSQGDSVDTEGSATIENGGEVDGDVNAGGDVTSRSESEIGGDVSAGGDVTAGSSSEIDGDVQSGGDVTTGYDSSIDGDVQSSGDVTAGSESELDGNVDADGTVTAGSGSEFGGDLSAGSDVTLGSDSEVNGDVYAGGDVVVRSGAEVDGSIDATGNVTVRSDAEVGGDIDAGGDVTISSGAEVDGTVSADGTVTDRR